MQHFPVNCCIPYLVTIRENTDHEIIQMSDKGLSRVLPIKELIWYIIYENFRSFNSSKISCSWNRQMLKETITNPEKYFSLIPPFTEINVSRK